jgi:hypothetical protein
VLEWEKELELELVVMVLMQAKVYLISCDGLSLPTPYSSRGIHPILFKIVKMTPINGLNCNEFAFVCFMKFHYLQRRIENGILEFVLSCYSRSQIQNLHTFKSPSIYTHLTNRIYSLLNKLDGNEVRVHIPTVD